MRTAAAAFVRALSVFAIVFAAACASTQESGADATGAGAAGGQSVVTVDNNHSSFTAMTIFLEPESGGVRQSLGTVEPGQARNFPVPLQRGWYRLVAQRPSGDLQSDRFNVPAASTITWDLSSNRVRVSTR